MVLGLFLGQNDTRFARCHFRVQNSLDFQGPPLPLFQSPYKWIFPHQNHYVPRHINHRYINGYYTSFTAVFSSQQQWKKINRYSYSVNVHTLMRPRLIWEFREAGLIGSDLVGLAAALRGVLCWPLQVILLLLLPSRLLVHVRRCSYLQGCGSGSPWMRVFLEAGYGSRSALKSKFKSFRGSK